MAGRANGRSARKRSHRPAAGGVSLMRRRSRRRLPSKAAAMAAAAKSPKLSPADAAAAAPESIGWPLADFCNQFGVTPDEVTAEVRSGRLAVEGIRFRDKDGSDG